MRGPRTPRSIAPSSPAPSREQWRDPIGPTQARRGGLDIAITVTEIVGDLGAEDGTPQRYWKIEAQTPEAPYFLATHVTYAA